jgi:hypothetical protein
MGIAYVQKDLGEITKNYIALALKWHPLLPVANNRHQIDENKRKKNFIMITNAYNFFLQQKDIDAYEQKLKDHMESFPRNKFRFGYQVDMSEHAVKQAQNTLDVALQYYDANYKVEMQTCRRVMHLASDLGSVLEHVSMLNNLNKNGRKARNFFEKIYYNSEVLLLARLALEIVFDAKMTKMKEKISKLSATIMQTNNTETEADDSKEDSSMATIHGGANNPGIMRYAKQPVLDFMNRHAIWSKLDAVPEHGVQIQGELADRITKKLIDNKEEIKRYWLGVGDVNPNDWGEISDYAYVEYRNSANKTCYLQAGKNHFEDCDFSVTVKDNSEPTSVLDCGIDTNGYRVYATIDKKDIAKLECEVLQMLRNVKKIISRYATTTKDRDWYEKTVKDLFEALPKCYAYRKASKYTTFSEYMYRTRPNGDIFKFNYEHEQVIGVLHETVARHFEYQKKSRTYQIRGQSKPLWAKQFTGEGGNAPESGNNQRRMFLAKYDEELLLRVFQKDYDIDLKHAIYIHKELLKPQVHYSNDASKKLLENLKIMNKSSAESSFDILTEFRHKQGEFDEFCWTIWRKSMREPGLYTILLNYFIAHFEATSTNAKTQYLYNLMHNLFFVETHHLIQFAKPNITEQERLDMKLRGNAEDLLNLFYDLVRVVKDVAHSQVLKSDTEWQLFTTGGFDPYECICAALVQNYGPGGGISQLQNLQDELQAALQPAGATIFDLLKGRLRSPNDEDVSHHEDDDYENYQQTYDTEHACINDDLLENLEASPVNCVLLAMYLMHEWLRDDLSNALKFEARLHDNVFEIGFNLQQQDADSQTTKIVAPVMQEVKREFLVGILASMDTKTPHIMRASIKRVVDQLCTKNSIPKTLVEWVNHEHGIGPSDPDDPNQCIDEFQFLSIYNYVKLHNHEMNPFQAVVCALVTKYDYWQNRSEPLAKWLVSHNQILTTSIYEYVDVLKKQLPEVTHILETILKHKIEQIPSIQQYETPINTLVDMLLTHLDASVVLQCMQDLNMLEENIHAIIKADDQKQALAQEKLQFDTNLHKGQLNPAAPEFKSFPQVPSAITKPSSTHGGNRRMPGHTTEIGTTDKRTTGDDDSSSSSSDLPQPENTPESDANSSTADNFKAMAHAKIMHYLHSNSLLPAYQQDSGKLPDVLLRSLSDEKIRMLLHDNDFFTLQIHFTQSNMQNYRNLLHKYIMDNLHVLINPLYVNGIIGFMVGDLTKKILDAWSENDANKNQLIVEAENTLLRVRDDILRVMKQRGELEESKYEPKHVVNVFLAYLPIDDLRKCLTNNDFRQNGIVVAKHKLKSWHDKIISTTHDLKITKTSKYKQSDENIFDYLLHTQQSNVLDQSLHNTNTAQYLVLFAVGKLNDYGDEIFKRLKAYENLKRVKLNKEKLTGMFLAELSVEQMDIMIRDDEYLTLQIAEAISALEEHAQKQAQKNQGDLSQRKKIRLPAQNVKNFSKGESEGHQASAPEPAAASVPGGANQGRPASLEVPTPYSADEHPVSEPAAASVPGGADQDRPASLEVPDAGASVAASVAQVPGMAKNDSWASRVEQGAPKKQGVPAAAPQKPAGKNKIAPAAVTPQSGGLPISWAKLTALASPSPAAGVKQQGSTATTDQDRRYDRLFQAMREIVEQLHKVPEEQKAHCGIVARALMIRYCLSEWFGNELHTFYKRNKVIMPHIIQIERLMLTVEEIRERTIQKQRVCIFPSGTDRFYSIDHGNDILVHARKASNMYDSFTTAVLNVFREYYPDFGVHNAYNLPMPFAFAGALESRQNNGNESENLIDTMLMSWPKKETNIELKRFLMPVSWKVQAFAFHNKLELQDVKADGECFFYAIAWMSISADVQQRNSNVRFNYTEDFLNYYKSLKQEMLDFMFEFLTDEWETENFSFVDAKTSNTFLEILEHNYDEYEPDEDFLKLAKVELSKLEYKTPYYTQIGKRKLEKVYAVYYNFMDSEHTRYGDLNTFGNLLCSILEIKEGIHLFNNNVSHLISSVKCGKLFKESRQVEWDNALEKIRTKLRNNYRAVLEIDKMYLLLKKGETENGNHYMVMRPVNPSVENRRRSVILDLSKEMQEASTPQHPAASHNASAYFRQEIPHLSEAPHQDAAQKTRLAHSAGASGGRDHAPPSSSAAACKQPDVAAEVAQLRQLASARNAAAQAASEHVRQQRGSAAACKQPDVAAEVAQLRLLASARNAEFETRVQRLRQEARHAVLNDNLDDKSQS